MDPRQARQLLVLTTVLVGLVATLTFWEAPDAPADPAATAEVWAVEADAVVRVEVDRRDDRLVLQREGERWRVLEPFEADADPGEVAELLDALAAVRRGVPIPADEPADFGLGADPVARVAVVLEGGAREALVVGDPAPVDHRTYVQGADGGVVAVDGRPSDLLTQSASWFRDHRILRFQPEDVRRVTLSGPEGTLTVHGQGRRWWLDGFARADADAVDDLVMGLLDLRFDTFDDVGDPPEPPVRTALVELEGGEPVRLLVGEPGPGGTPVWTHDGREGRALTAALALLGQGPTDLGDDQAFPLDVHDADAVIVTRGGRRWEARRQGFEWSAGEAAADAVRGAVDRLAAAGIHYRREPVPAVTDTWATVEVHDGGETWTVDVGQVLDDTWRVARDRDGGEPYLVPLDDLAVLEALP